MTATEADFHQKIGAVIVEWSKIEKQITLAIHAIDLALARTRTGLPRIPPASPLTDLTTIRRFRHRKGRLRQYVEQHGTTAELRELDRIYQKLAKLKPIRDSFGHDLIDIIPATEARPIRVSAFNYDKMTSGTSTEPTEYTAADLDNILGEMKECGIGNVVSRIIGKMAATAHH